MKHIKEILAQREYRAFANPKEKGSEEWGTFNVVRGDHIDTYPVAKPERPIVVREPHHVLRIVYPHIQNAH